MINQKLVTVVTDSAVVDLRKALSLLLAPQPLTMDRFRHQIRQLGHLSDGFFSGTVARIKRHALVALIELIIPKANQANVINKLTAKRYQGKDGRALVIGVLKKRVAEKIS